MIAWLGHLISASLPIQTEPIDPKPLFTSRYTNLDQNSQDFPARSVHAFIGLGLKVDFFPRGLLS